MKYMIFLLPVFILWQGTSCQQTDHSPPSIVLINIDDMGWKDPGFMGSLYYETPNIDRLSARGIIFTNAYASASNCAPSRACLMTGRWTPRHGIYTVASSDRGDPRHRKLIPVRNRETLSTDLPVIPEILKNEGYMTIHSGKWHLSEDPVDYGFLINIGGSHAGHPESYYPPYGNVDVGDAGGKYLTDRIMELTIRCLDIVRHPFFLNYAPYAVHTPIQPVTRLLEKYGDKNPSNGQHNAAYATMVENVDRNIGQLVNVLKEKGLIEQTLIVFTTDNGGVFGITEQPPLRAGKGSYYEGGIRVPFFIVWEGHIRPSTVSDLPVTQLDLFPTLLEIAGIGMDTYPHDGLSIWPVLNGTIQRNGTEEILSRPLFWHFPIYLEAYDVHYNENRDSLFRTRPGSVIRYKDWKLHHYFEDNGIELYNLKNDPSERDNLAGKNPQKAAELYRMLEAWRQKTGAPVPAKPNPEYEMFRGE